MSVLKEIVIDGIFCYKEKKSVKLTLTFFLLFVLV